MAKNIGDYSLSCMHTLTCFRFLPEIVCNCEASEPFACRCYTIELISDDASLFIQD